ncbi:MAG: hypothetical protein HYW90_00090 [Candidatus Sungbacteria bacterium]|nr:hypothetical protein [Candidatus Sungbacteria bacterium]
MITDMRNAVFHIVRVGTAITFLWVGVLILQDPENWGGLLRPWAAGLLPLSVAQTMVGTAVLDIAIGFFLLIDRWTFLFSLFAFFHLLAVLTVVGIDAVTVRDIGLAASALALAVGSWPRYER